MARPMPPLAPVTMAISLWLMISPGFLNRPLLQRPRIDALLGADGRGDQLLERTALDFLRRSQRHRRHERDIAGRLVVGEPAQTPRDDVGRDLLARSCVRQGALADHAGKDFVATHRIRGRGHRDLFDGGMLHQHALDLDRRDVFAGAADDILLAVDEMKRAVRAAPDHVPGMKPAAIPGFVGGFGVLEVFAEEPVAWRSAGVANQQFTGLIDTGFRAAIGNDARLELRSKAAEATRAGVARLLR